MASEKGHRDVVKTLFEAGADLNIQRSSVSDVMYCYKMHMSQNRGSYCCVVIDLSYILSIIRTVLILKRLFCCISTILQSTNINSPSNCIYSLLLDTEAYICIYMNRLQLKKKNSRL